MERNRPIGSKLCARTVGGIGVLVPIRGLKSYLGYSIDGLPGAMLYPFLAKVAADKLELASEILKETIQFGTAEIILWDAYRTRETQAFIFSRYRSGLALASPEMSQNKLNDKAKEFVNPPDEVFPHGTGGAVDVTLFINGRVAHMGTDFDAFVPESSADWFQKQNPETNLEAEAGRSRYLLRQVMEKAGFVGTTSKWWHFEYGTQTWADITGNAPILNTVLPCPTVEGPASAPPTVPLRQPLMQSGVAQIFNSHNERADSLAHQKPGHYYARNSHPTIEGLAAFIKSSIVPSKEAILCESGLSACLLALKGLVPKDGRILYDRRIYYEVESGALTLADRRGWKFIGVDFTKNSTWATGLCDKFGKIDVFYCDNPRNWWLDSMDIQRISQIAHNHDAIFIVDTSLQPVQNVLGKGVDVAVFSLSKYPSLGMTLGGCILSNDSGVIGKIGQVASEEGHVLAPEAAMTIWNHIIGLRDHMQAVSEKAQRIAEFLQSHQAILRVRVPDKRYTDGLIGGQLTFHMKSFEQAHIMERVVGQNSLMASTCLHLACTFGASFSTFEHFHSNIRHRTGISREDTNEVAIPSDLVRIGIGCESADRIIEELKFLLDVTDRRMSIGEAVDGPIHSQAKLNLS